MVTQGNLFDQNTQAKPSPPPKGPVPDFDGRTYDRQFDYERLKTKFEKVFECMKDGRWRTIDEICAITGIDIRGSAGVSARLRDMRKAKFGGHTLNRRSPKTTGREKGVHEYQLIVNENAAT